MFSEGLGYLLAVLWQQVDLAYEQNIERGWIGLESAYYAFEGPLPVHRPCWLEVLGLDDVTGFGVLLECEVGMGDA